MLEEASPLTVVTLSKTMPDPLPVALPYKVKLALLLEVRLVPAPINKAALSPLLNPDTTSVELVADKLPPL